MNTSILTGSIFTFDLDGRDVSIGRDPSCGLVIEGVGVSRHHAILRLDNVSPTIEDSGSTYGISIDDVPVKKAPLTRNSTITIGIQRFTVDIREGKLALIARDPLARKSHHGGAQTHADELCIGRDDDCDLQLDHPLVSRIHAMVKDDGTTLGITDNHSTNGTFVNGRPVTKSALVNGDVVQIGPYRLFVENGKLVRGDYYNRITLEANRVTVKIRERLLLDKVSLSISPGEFVAILGPSGAGKTTLARVLTGHLAPTSGEVFANGLPLKKFLGAFASNMGYVAQTTVLHEELTVAETFREQCRLRLSGDSTGAERVSRIHEVMDLLELDRVKQSMVRNLSGGEAKRVHLGIELLASPALIFLDEPLSGLDPGLVKRFMELFRRICDKGHSLLLTTHTLEQIDLCDRVIFMHRGQVLFQGPPSLLAQTFNAESLPGVYDKVICSEPQALPPVPDTPDLFRPVPDYAAGGARDKVMMHTPRTMSQARQLLLLLRRYSIIFSRDKRNALLVFAQAPLLGVLLGCVFELDSTYLPMSFYFCVTITSIWIGGVSTVREIAREGQLLDRDIRVGLSLFSYVFSKVFLFGAIALLQAVLFSGCLSLLFKVLDFNISFVLLTASATVSGALLGLCVSALSANAGRAVSMLPVIFIPQIFFSGIMIPFDSMTAPGRILSYLTISRPVFGMFKRHFLLHIPITEMNDWQGLFFLAAGIIILMLVSVRLRIARDPVSGEM